MPVNHEVKSTLAKLLATEDLVVEHKKVSTACFNVHTRVLTLPMWEKASNTVYDMLVGHEVGHALYTPDEDWSKQHKIPAQYVNVTEDARIEKLMKRRYAGLNKVFYNAYQELNADDFFGIADEDLKTFNLADRANLWFKIGNYINVPIERDEMDIINMIADAETFQDAVDAAVALYEYCKKEQKSKETVDIQLDCQQTEQSGGGQSSFDAEESVDGQGKESQDNSKESESTDSEDQTNKSEVKEDINTGGVNGDLDVKTVDKLNEAIQELINMDGFENVYLELPKLDLNSVVVENSEIHNCVESFWKESVFDNVDSFRYVDSLYNKFKKNAQKEVNYMVKEFECRKAADSYARASTARTGVLDCTKLHTYKFNEDLFKKVTTFADGKNHGLVFVLDWSGSMSQVMLDTLKQLYNIIWFCRKVNIPFDVYAFTNEWKGYHRDENGNPVYPTDHYVKKENLLCVDKSFSLLNLFSDKVKNKQLDDQLRNIFRIAYAFNNYCSYGFPSKITLSGTPLNESLIALHQIIPHFKSKNKVQKVQCVVLTDGEAHHIPYHAEVRRGWESEPYIGVRRIGENSFIRNRKTGMTYKVKTNSYTSFTDTLLDDLRDTFSDVNFIGIRILLSRDANHFIRNNSSGERQDALISQWKKERSVILTETGYHRYFGMSSSALSNEVQFSVEEDATKSAIRNAFKKSLNSKKMNKKFLNEFVKLIA